MRCNECKHGNSVPFSTNYECKHRDVVYTVEDMAKYHCSDFFKKNVDNDSVNKPKHYNRDGAMECFDEFVAIYGVEAGIYACLFNIHKYRYRAADKNGIEDLQKSDNYMRKFIELKARYEAGEI